MKKILLGLLCVFSITIVYAADFDHRSFAWNDSLGRFCSGAKITNNTNKNMRCEVTLYYYSHVLNGNTSRTQTNIVSAYTNDTFGMCSGADGRGNTVVSSYEVSCKYVK